MFWVQGEYREDISDLDFRAALYWNGQLVCTPASTGLFVCLASGTVSRLSARRRYHFCVTGRRARPGANQRVLSGHWPANVVRSAYRENACSCCVEGTCCEAGRKGPLP